MTLETHLQYGTTCDLEWPDLWDEYDRTRRAYEEAHETPRRKYGLSDSAGGAFIQELRIVDQSGECLARLQRSQSALRRAEDSLKQQIVSLQANWSSSKVFGRILALFDGHDCRFRSELQQAVAKMRVDESVVDDLVILAGRPSGFKCSVKALVNTGTRLALHVLKRLKDLADDNQDRAVQINDAAVDISVKLGDARVIAVLVHRLEAAYQSNTGTSLASGASPDQPTSQEIIDKILTVMRHESESLSPRLLTQLSGLGMDAGSRRSASRGLDQAMISKELQPIRDLASRELQRRRKAS